MGQRPTDRGINFSVQIYNRSQVIEVQPGCKSLMLTNTGDTIARVNGMVLFPSSTPLTDLGDSRTIGGSQDEVILGAVIRLAFDVPGGATPQIEVIQIFYV